MDETVKQTTTVTQDSLGNTTRSTVRTNYNVFSGDFFISKVNQIIFALVTIVNLLVLLRFLFLLFGANRTGFVLMLVNLTNFFVAPFQGIFPTPIVEGAYLELASVLAIVVWYILAWILAVIISLFSSSTEEVA